MRWLLIALLLLPVAQAYNNPFDAGWQSQAERPQIKLCYCFEDGHWITGVVYPVHWHTENFWQDICELPERYRSACWLPGGEEELRQAQTKGVPDGKK